MTATTDHYLGIQVHKQEAQVAAIDDEGEVTQKVHVPNADFDELAEKYAGEI
jgi:predicted NBD/HSP70 family sugar kinase